MKYIFFIFLFTINFFHSSIANAIEVGGHLTVDTTWSAANNPYLVTSDVYVDEGVILNILPGTKIKFNAAPDLNQYSMNPDFVYSGGLNTAKMLWVDGKVIAEGTEEEPILFTRLQDSLYYHWGVVYIREGAGISSFKHCSFRNSAFMLIVLGIIPRGAISIYNEGAIIDNCEFIDNKCGVFVDRTPTKLQVTNSTFYNIDNLSDPLYHQGGIFAASTSEVPLNKVLIAGNTISEFNISDSHIDAGTESSYYIAGNSFENVGGIRLIYNFDYPTYIYNNQFSSNAYASAIYGGNPENRIYIKKNSFVGGTDGIDLSRAYVEISDNYLDGCMLQGPLEFELMGSVKNNIIKNNSGRAISGRFEKVYNNIFYNCEIVSSVIGSSDLFTNNLMINNLELCTLLADTPVIENNVIIGNRIDDIEIMNNPIFRNCIIDFPLDPPLIDGGGNIIVDSLQAQEIFVDIENGDFHLAANSIAIDAGFDTLGYYYPFDLDNSVRVWDGDGDGNAIIDIGAYEYEAPQLGKSPVILQNPLAVNQ